MEGNHKSKKLSKNILEMNFMKRSKESAEEQQEDSDRRAMFGHKVTGDMEQAQGRFVMDPSYIRFENLRFGWMSFKGMNPLAEELMKQAEQKESKNTVAKKSVKVKEKSVSDQEMAQNWHFGVDDVDMHLHTSGVENRRGRPLGRQRTKDASQIEKKCQ